MLIDYYYGMVDLHIILGNLVFTYLNFYDKHTYKRMNAYANRMKITDLFNIDKKYLKKLDYKILLDYKFVVRLNAGQNYGITDVNYLTNLKELKMNSLMRNGHIKKLNLEKLDANFNSIITNLELKLYDEFKRIEY